MTNEEQQIVCELSAIEMWTEEDTPELIQRSAELVQQLDELISELEES